MEVGNGERLPPNAAHEIKHYNPVTITLNGTVGAIVVSVVALALLVALLRSQARYRAVLARLAGEESG